MLYNVVVAKYKFIGPKGCKRLNCPVLLEREYEMDEKGGDDFLLYRNVGVALEQFGEQIFAMCPSCTSHASVEKVSD